MSTIKDYILVLRAHQRVITEDYNITSYKNIDYNRTNGITRWHIKCTDNAATMMRLNDLIVVSPEDTIDISNL